MDGYVAPIDPAYIKGVEKDNKAARQYFETAAHLVSKIRYRADWICREIQRLL
jgi:hypothetical protein